MELIVKAQLVAGALENVGGVVAVDAAMINPW
ncbi:MAG: hypothetical protein BWY57_02664 [Betaproteobacteria bacterium ADurb.Bin341]|nr:MAG: hypothetical protein BWY57_02664 [Betaproteobacteria bacterium ADurb.Bin341]